MYRYLWHLSGVRRKATYFIMLCSTNDVTFTDNTVTSDSCGWSRETATPQFMTNSTKYFSSDDHFKCTKWKLKESDERLAVVKKPDFFN